MNQVAPDIMDEYDVYGLVHHKMVTYVELMKPDTFLKLEDLAMMWQLVNLKTIVSNV